MTYPSANPGGEDTWLVRQALHDWLEAQSLPDVTSIELTLQPALYFDEFAGSGEACMLLIDLPDDEETRGALTGPDDPGGKDVHYTAMIQIRHRGFSADGWADSQRSYDRVKDAVKQALRGVGRDLGRPDVILQVGEWPKEQGISHNRGEIVEADGLVDHFGVITFTVSQYLPTFIPGEPA